MATCTATNTCCRAFLCRSLVLSPNEATFVCCYYPTYGENHFSSYFAFLFDATRRIYSFVHFFFVIALMENGFLRVE